MNSHTAHFISVKGTGTRCRYLISLLPRGGYIKVSILKEKKKLSIAHLLSTILNASLDCTCVRMSSATELCVDFQA